MQNRWSAAEARRFVDDYGRKSYNADLALRVYTSRLLGAESALVLHGGGNTSVKTRVCDVVGDDVAVLCVKGEAAAAVLSAAAPALAGKTVIDTTNPISAAPAEGGVLRYFSALDDSLMERLQSAHPGVHLVKAFNSVGNTRMVNPRYAEGRPTMFICGDDAAAKATVSSLLDAFGWDTVDMGGVRSARAIEPLCMLWCIPGYLRNEWGHAFKLLR